MNQDLELNYKGAPFPRMTVDKENYKIVPKAPWKWQLIHEQGSVNLYSRDGILKINEINFDELPEAPVRAREPLARSKTTINMNGQRK